MNEYYKWAEEYKTSADLTKEKIDELEKKRKRCRSVFLKNEYGGKLLVLYGQYNDCLYSYKELLRKAERAKDGW